LFKGIIKAATNREGKKIILTVLTFNPREAGHGEDVDIVKTGSVRCHAGTSIKVSVISPVSTPFPES
jgi:hypothetical protein